MTSQEATPTGNEKIEQIWHRVRELLKVELGAQRFQYWIDPMRIISADGERVVIACTSRFERDKVVESHGERIANLIADLAPGLGAVDFIVEAKPRVVAQAAAVSARATTLESLVAMPSADPVLVPGSTPLNRNYTFDNFVVGKSNQVAFQESKRTAGADQPVSNPLFLYGPTGLGKTHLMHAIAWRKLQQDPNLRVLLITAETFMRMFVTALKANETIAFKNQMRNVDLLLVDDLHFVLGKEATQEELLAALDWLSDNQKQIILSADRSPSLFENISDRARSRLLKGASIEIAPTDFELRLAILEAKARVVSRERPGFVLNTEAAHFMAQRIATNTRELEGALNRVVTQSGDGARAITIDSLNLWLADFLRAYDRRVTIEEIKKKTADHFGLKVSDLESPNRSRSIVRPRQIAMHLARQLTPRSYPEIGRRFGNRDHTTVMHAVETIQRLTGLDPAFGEEVERLRLSIRNWPIEASVTIAKPSANAEGEPAQG
ncbi:MAG: chromosomal replication initiator protein DnaA [Alphaproteobacteria bacterium]|nr:chromosomal replication initiator protein DnaA [Alphaproteobacteria bacterium]